ncbi:hypothetical protein RRG08_006534 [Elysia crispata]|uniref:Uncharacterized protein n=1 Tax=Elysia crispata TaxID=231223 RepID=A0AAE1E4H0_9GAST|nr:hypothetical protein RRG08_006534 [Elysia crispata]
MVLRLRHGSNGLSELEKYSLGDGRELVIRVVYRKCWPERAGERDRSPSLNIAVLLSKDMMVRIPRICENGQSVLPPCCISNNVMMYIKLPIGVVIWDTTEQGETDINIGLL